MSLKQHQLGKSNNFCLNSSWLVSNNIDHMENLGVSLRCCAECYKCNAHLLVARRKKWQNKNLTSNHFRLKEPKYALNLANLHGVLELEDEDSIASNNNFIFG